MQHAPINDPARYRLEKLGVGNASELAAKLESRGGVRTDMVLSPDVEQWGPFLPQNDAMDDHLAR
jgi:hypothetical protein